MNNHRYILQPYKSIADRHTCPSCLNIKKFTKYIDTLTNEPLSDLCGRCDRVDSCGYHFTPREFFTENPDKKLTNSTPYSIVLTPPKHDTSFIDKSVVERTLSNYEINVFTKFLDSTFGLDMSKKAIQKYKLGTTKNGATIYYQIDLGGNIRSGKIIQYNVIDSLFTHNRRDCKRNKYIMITWVHKALELNDYNLCQCFFGEHLLTDQSKTICIVESEKSAVIASIFKPQYIWIACGGKEGLGSTKIQVLKDRHIVLFPDLNGFNKWTQKAKEIEIIAKSVLVSPILEGIATNAERNSGLDIADYFLRYPAPT